MESAGLVWSALKKEERASVVWILFGCSAFIYKKGKKIILAACFINEEISAVSRGVISGVTLDFNSWMKVEWKWYNKETEERYSVEKTDNAVVLGKIRFNWEASFYQKKKKKLRSFLPTVSPKKLVVTIFWGFTNSNLLRCNICSSRCSKLQPPRIRRRPFSWFERVKSLWPLYYWCNRWSNSSANASDTPSWVLVVVFFADFTRLYLQNWC